MSKKENKNLKTFSIHETNINVANYFKKAILKHKHLENIINILINSECEKIFSLPKENRDFKIYNLLLDPRIMRAVPYNYNGKDATKKQIKYLNDYFKDDPLFLSFKEIGTILNDKNIYSVVSRLKKDWKNSFKNLKKFYDNPSLFNGKPSTPKAKKLTKVYNYSVPLEVSKFSMKHKDKFGVTIYKKSKKVFLRDNDYVKSKKINGITVSLSHGHIYYNFNYIVPEVTKNQTTFHPLKNKPVKQSGLDIGVKNLFALFVNDFTTQSLIYKSSKLIHYNVNFNKHLSKLNELIALQVSRYKEIKKEEKTIKIPLEYTNYGKHLIKKRSHLWNQRNLFMESEMQKISTNILTFLKSKDVTDLVISKSLQFAKIDGSIEQRKKDKQNFYQIPFGKLLNLIEEKSIKYNINVINKNEAYTSKTSCLSSNVNLIQEKSKTTKITSNELNGVRGVKKQKIGRGIFKDTQINKIINSDLNGAANHIKLGFNDIDLSVFKNHLWKVCNPKTIKSSNEFDKFILSNSNAKQQVLI
jgi:IS605 OrfB family transposase